MWFTQACKWRNILVNAQVKHTTILIQTRKQKLLFKQGSNNYSKRGNANSSGLYCFCPGYHANSTLRVGTGHRVWSEMKSCTTEISQIISYMQRYSLYASLVSNQRWSLNRSLRSFNGSGTVKEKKWNNFMQRSVNFTGFSFIGLNAPQKYWHLSQDFWQFRIRNRCAHSRGTASN